MLAAWVLTDSGLFQFIAHEPGADFLCGAEPRLFSVMESEHSVCAGVFELVSAMVGTSSEDEGCVFSCLWRSEGSPRWLCEADMMSLCIG